MRRARIRNMVTGVEVRVHATIDHPDSSYGQPVWVDDDNYAYCLVDSQVPNPFYQVIEEEDS